MRVVHYINQFFAGLGGEERAGEPPQRKDGPLGPGALLQRTLGDDVVVGTVLCGDNYIAEHGDEAVAAVLEHVLGYEPDLVIAGPAFNAGRYGAACAAVVAAVQDRGIPAVTAMHPENPAVGQAVKATYVVPTTINASGMAEAIEGMVGIGRKLVAGESLGMAEDEGYLPRGLRRNVFSDRIGAERAVEQLLRKIAGEPFTTEIPLPTYDRVAPTPLSADLSTLRLALVTEASVVPAGNPDRLESARCTHWLKYPLLDMDDLARGEYETVHGGFDNAMINADPDRVLPLDAVRELEREGVIGHLHEDYYVTTGMATAIAEAERIGREIAADLKQQDIQAVLVTST